MDNITQNLILAYDRNAEERDNFEVAEWKVDLRWKFFELIELEGKSTLIDLGAGTGVHAQFFQDQGLAVTCIDLSPAHVEKCREKGLECLEMNLLDLDDLSRDYDCAVAFSSLLHIPSQDLPGVLTRISQILVPGGLFFWGQYGGESREGVYQDDYHDPKRFFSLLTDDQMCQMASREFEVEKFERQNLEKDAPLYFQVATLRVKSKAR